MRHLIIGAGSSVAEAIALGVPEKKHPPLISNFGRKLWGNFNPHPLLERYLDFIGHKVEGDDGRPLFWELEENGEVNIERFFEFVWTHRKKAWDLSQVIRGKPVPGFIQGGFLYDGSLAPSPQGLTMKNDFLENFVYHGIKTTLGLIILQGFFENGNGFKQLVEARKISSLLKGGDMVLNLNYDTLFEIGLLQSGIRFAYCPFSATKKDIVVCKPHGSLNLASKEGNKEFMFRSPKWLGLPIPRGYTPGGGIVPPRFKKNYKEHPIADAMVKAVKSRRPDVVSFWGVGLAESDADLISLYGGWGHCSKLIEVINPARSVADRVERIFGSSKVTHFYNVDEWVVSQKGCRTAG